MVYALRKNGEIVVIFGAHSRALEALKFYATEYPDHKWQITLATCGDSTC